MKRSSIAGMLLLLVLSGGCNNTYTVKTKINPDGSFEKTIVCEGDSLGLAKLPLPFEFKDGWRLETRKTQEQPSRFVTTAVKRYASTEEMQAENAKASDSTKLALTGSVEKRFRWFYTYYRYEERIPAFGRFHQRTPFTQAFTQAEIERLGTGKDSLLNKRFDEYWTRTIMDELIDRMIAASRPLNDPALAPSRWEEKRDVLIKTIFEKDLSKPAVLVTYLEKTFGTSSVEKISGALDSLMTEMIGKVKNENDLDVSFTNEVAMPGMLVASNAKDVEGSTVTWMCRPHRCIDVVMTAESRVLNLWAVVATTVVCLVILAALVLPVVRMRRQTV